jgi:hypothetical protein
MSNLRIIFSPFQIFATMLLGPVSWIGMWVINWFAGRRINDRSSSNSVGSLVDEADGALGTLRASVESSRHRQSRGDASANESSVISGFEFHREDPKDITRIIPRYTSSRISSTKLEVNRRKATKGDLPDPKVEPALLREIREENIRLREIVARLGHLTSARVFVDKASLDSPNEGKGGDEDVDGRFDKERD